MGETSPEAAWRLAFGALTSEEVFALREGRRGAFCRGVPPIAMLTCFALPIWMLFCAQMLRAIRV